MWYLRQLKDICQSVIAKSHGLICWTEATTAAALAMGDGGAVGKGKDSCNGTRMGMEQSIFYENPKDTCKTIQIPWWRAFFLGEWMIPTNYKRTHFWWRFKDDDLDNAYELLELEDDAGEKEIKACVDLRCENRKDLSMAQTNWPPKMDEHSWDPNDQICRYMFLFDLKHTYLSLFDWWINGEDILERYANKNNLWSRCVWQHASD